MSMNRFTKSMNILDIPEITVKKNSATDLKQIIESYAGEKIIKIPKGTFTLKDDITIPTTNGIIILGSGEKTIIDVGTYGKWFKFQDADIKRLQIGNFLLDGKSTANVKGIDSTALTGQHVLDMTEIHHIWAKDFDGANSIPLDMRNWERGSLHHFYTIGNISSGGARVKLTTDSSKLNSVGNLQIYDFFMSGMGQNDVPMIDCRIAAVHIAHGHFHSTSSYRGLAVKITSEAHQLSFGSIRDVRCEYTQLLHTAQTSGEDIKYWTISDNKVWGNDANNVLIDLIAYCKGFRVHDNVLYENGGGYAFKDQNENSNDLQINHFVDNICKGQVDYTATTHIENNEGVNPIGLVTNFRKGADKFTAKGLYSNISANTDYTIKNTDCIITVSGGTGVDITIKDPNGNEIASLGASCTGYRIKRGCKINFGNFTEAPTIKIAWL